MKCPSCSTEISDAVDACPTCEFTLDELDALAREAGLPGQKPGEDLVDDAGVLTRQGAARIQDRIDHFEGGTGAELRVWTAPSVAPLQTSEAAFWLFNRWEMGGEGHRGLLVLLATRDRRVQCEVGYGLESMLTDEEAGRVLDRHVVPLLRRGAFDEGLYQAVDLLADLVELALEDARADAEAPAGAAGQGA